MLYRRSELITYYEEVTVIVCSISELWLPESHGSLGKIPRFLIKIISN